MAEVDIKKVAEEYIENNNLSNKYGKIANSLKSQLKEYIPAHNCDSISTDAGTVVLSYRIKTSFNEDKLIPIFENDKVMSRIVKTKKYIDFDILESMMYHEEVSEEMQKILYDNKVETETAVITVQKKRKGVK